MRRLLALLLLFHTTNAFADPDAFVAPDRAARLFDEGRELKAAGKIDQACERFARSWQVERAAGTELNLADCKEREGKLLEAWELFDEAARISEQQGNSTRVTFARNRAAAIDARLMTIDVRLAAPIAKNTLVTIDGQPAMHERVDPRAVQIRASAPDGKSYAVVVAAQPGKVVVEIPSLVRTTTQRRRSWLWLVGGGAVFGVTALVVGQQLAMIAGDIRDDVRSLCPPDQSGALSCDDPAFVDTANHKLAIAREDDIAAVIIAGTGAAALVGAGVLWYVAPRERVLVTPTATTSSVGVAVSTRF